MKKSRGSPAFLNLCHFLLAQAVHAEFAKDYNHLQPNSVACVRNIARLPEGNALVALWPAPTRKLLDQCSNPRRRQLRSDTSRGTLENHSYEVSFSLRLPGEKPESSLFKIRT